MKEMLLVGLPQMLVVLLFVLPCALLLAGRRKRTTDLDLMDGHDFEYFCAELLEKDGFGDVVVTKGSGDYGIDILAEKDGVTYAIQCKRYSETVGVGAIQQAYAGKDYYGCMVGVVLTNQYFSKPAVEFAGKLKVILWDRDYLETLMESSEV